MTLYQLKCSCCGDNVVLDDTIVKCKKCLQKDANAMLRRKFGKKVDAGRLMRMLDDEKKRRG